MAIFGDNCDRCGQRTKRKEADRPICEVCAQEMALMVDASAENARTCPVDGAEMGKEIAHMIVIDRCPQCKGVWLDAGELEHIRADLGGASLVLMAKGFAFPAA